MTDPSNVALVLSIFAGWERGDFRRADWADPGIEFVVADSPSPGVWKGLTATAQSMRSWISAWSEFRVEADEYGEVDAERVLVLSHNTVRGRASGLELGQMSRTAVLSHVRNAE